MQGFGFLQTYEVESGTKSLTFQVPAFEYVTTTKAMLRSEEQSYPSIAVHPNAKNFYNTYTFYEGVEGMYNEEPAYMYLNDMKTESLYAKPKTGVSLSTTGASENGAEIWATYLSGGLKPEIVFGIVIADILYHLPQKIQLRSW